MSIGIKILIVSNGTYKKAASTLAGQQVVASQLHYPEHALLGHLFDSL